MSISEAKSDDFSGSSAGIVKEGFMKKRGDGTFSKGWRKRYFTLEKNGDMRYFVDEERKTQKGIIKMGGSKLIVDDNQQDPVLGIRPEGSTRVYVLQAESKEDKEEWIAAIEKVCAHLHRAVRKGSITAELPKVKYQGFLNKRGEKGLAKGWRLRWFAILDDGEMNYYETEKMKVQKGGLVAKGATLVIDGNFPLEFGVKPAGQERVYILQCDNEEEISGWLSALKDLEVKESRGVLRSQGIMRGSSRVNTGAVDIGAMVMKGFLLKKGEKGLLKDWKRRFFALFDNSQMNYYIDDKMTSKKGGYIVGAGEIYINEKEDDPDYLDDTYIMMIKPEGSERVYALQADDKASKDAWVKALGLAGARVEKVNITEKFPWLGISAPVEKPDDLVCCGWLNKKGDIGLRTWKRRYFGIFNDKTIQYYADEGLKQRKGGFLLERCRLITQDSQNTALMFGLQPYGTERIYVLEADTDEDHRNWMMMIKQFGAVAFKGILIEIDDNVTAGIINYKKEGQQDNLPPGWVKKYMNNQAYYYNEEMDETSWVPPVVKKEKDEEEEIVVMCNPNNRRAE